MRSSGLAHSTPFTHYTTSFFLRRFKVNVENFIRRLINFISLISCFLFLISLSFLFLFIAAISLPIWLAAGFLLADETPGLFAAFDTYTRRLTRFVSILWHSCVSFYSTVTLCKTVKTALLSDHLHHTLLRTPSCMANCAAVSMSII